MRMLTFATRGAEAPFFWLIVGLAISIFLIIMSGRGMPARRGRGRPRGVRRGRAGHLSGQQRLPIAFNTAPE